MSFEAGERILLANKRDTLDFGEALGKHAHPGLLVLLAGELGTGKTTLVKGLARGMGARPIDVASPTYTIAKRYETPRGPLLHVDLYRMNGTACIEDTGAGEALERKDAVVAVEWADHIDLSDYPALHIRLEYHADSPESGRMAEVRADVETAGVLEKTLNEFRGHQL